MHDPRKRLFDEYQKLLRLERRSKFIKVEPMEVQPGHPPEKYLITYTCLGIARITPDGEPEPSDFHQVEMHLIDFPSKEPALTWKTDIWHPNIEHDGPRKVCTDNPKSWFPTKSLDFLVITMGLMVQYQRYHAKWSPPYPIDKKAAKWVLDYAEPHHIVGPKKPFDDRPLLRRMIPLPADWQPEKRPDPPSEAKEKRQRVVFGKPEAAVEKRKKVVFGKPFSDEDH